MVVVYGIYLPIIVSRFCEAVAQGQDKSVRGDRWVTKSSSVLSVTGNSYGAPVNNNIIRSMGLLGPSVARRADHDKDTVGSWSPQYSLLYHPHTCKSNSSPHAAQRRV